MPSASDPDVISTPALPPWALTWSVMAASFCSSPCRSVAATVYWFSAPVTRDRISRASSDSDTTWLDDLKRLSDSSVRPNCCSTMGSWASMKCRVLAACCRLIMALRSMITWATRLAVPADASGVGPVARTLKMSESRTGSAAMLPRMISVRASSRCSSVYPAPRPRSSAERVPESSLAATSAARLRDLISSIWLTR